MHFDLPHEFDAPADAVVEALANPKLYESLSIPDIGPLVVVAHERTKDAVAIDVAYHFTGKIDGAVRNFIGNRPIQWIQATRIQLKARSATFTVTPNVQPKRLRGFGSWLVTPIEDGRSRRDVSFDLQVRIPVVGSGFENALAPGLVRRIDLESAALRGWLRGRV